MRDTGAPTAPSPASTPPPTSTAAPRRIGAVDGLRGLALTLVVAFHLFGNGRVSGGVDVFLLLSGYFATGALLRRAESGTLRLAAHYAHTLARLLPAALVVLATVTVALLTLAPRMRWSSGLREVGASATFWENWELVHASLAYGAAGPGASPLQHFWSLSVQGQFFAAWPLVVLGLVVVAQRRVRAGRTLLTPGRLVAVVTGIATAASFGYALWLVSADQPVAYFSTFTRFWEIGAGALLALALRRGVPFRGQSILGWAGLALVVGSGFLVDGARVFPGASALVPVGGGALVLLATVPGSTAPGVTVVGVTVSGMTVPGPTVPNPTAPDPTAPDPTVPDRTAPGSGARSASRTASGTAEGPTRYLRPFSKRTPNASGPAGPSGSGVERFLDSAPLRFGARVSYALYLWHWPVLVFWLLTTGAHRADPLAAAGILVVSAALAWLTTRYVAEPLLAHVTDRLAARHAKAASPAPSAAHLTGDVTARGTTAPSGRRTLAVLAGAAVLVLGGTQAAATAHDATVQHNVAGLLAPSPDHPGAAALAPDAPSADARPAVPFRPATWVAYDDHPDRPGCVQGGDRPELLECAVVSPPDPTAVVYLAGASHEQQYEEAFVALAREHGWELREVLKHGCRLATSGEGGMAYPPDCATWNDQALGALVAARPDVVVVVGTRTYEDGAPERVMSGQVDAWRALDDAGIRVVTVRDNPRFEWFVPECIEGATDPEACGRPRAEQLAATSPVPTAPGVPGSAIHLDLTDSICGPEVCDAVVGNVLVYRDDDHLTNTYVRTLTPVIGRQLRSGAPWLFDAGPDAENRLTAGSR
ncbi:peptidoglycan/LPS O-acetylase OafA/YrhL [Promicromonospora sp. AC04]|uniref:acyltransferase family protein n=1 Tax=Promicromonospora sp. AC04 TaxID=2135723 RepID=UPI000D4B323D|nr:acyltransferase family protein [Promicromonospora sp. AC04]PUB20160.1 peptidoglycan/LPS O-acetylase OafA/YrhL [Promicromonospora sp. AC04]